MATYTKKHEYVETTIFTSAVPHDITLSPALSDITKTIMIVTIEGGDDTATSMPNVQLIDTTTVRFDRGGGSGGTLFSATVTLLEFSAGVSVQHKNLVGTATTQAINSVTLAQSFIIPGGCNTSSGSYGTDETAELEFNSQTEVGILTSAEAARGAGDEWAYQVVDYTGCNSYEINDIFDDAALSHQTTHTSVSTAGVVAIFGSMKRGADSSAYQPGNFWRPDVPAATTIDWDRPTDDQHFEVTLFVVEFTDGTTVQSAQYDSSTGAASGSITSGVSAFEADNSVGFGMATNQLCTAHATCTATGGEQVDTVYVEYSLDEATPGLDWVRTTGTLVLELYWQIIEWSTGAATTPKGVFGKAIHGPLTRAVY